MRGAGPLLIAVVLLLPLASASFGEGYFLTRGHIEFPWGNTLTFKPLLLYNNNTAAITHLSVASPHAKLHHLEMDHYDIAGVVVSPPNSLRNNTYNLTDFAMSLSPREGHVVLYPGIGLTGTLAASEAIRLEPREETVFANTELNTLENPYYDGMFFQQTVQTRHVFGESAGAVTLAGPLLMKVYGPTVRVESEAGTEHFATGTEVNGGFMMTVRWVLVELPAGATLTADSTAAWQFAGRDVEAESDGTVRFLPVKGQFETWNRRYPATDGIARFEGTFHAALGPVERERQLLMELRLSGELLSTSLRPEAVPLTAQVVQNPGFALRWSFLALGVVAAAGGIFWAGSWAARRRAPAEAVPEPVLPFTVEDCMDAARKAADEEDWPKAAVWFERAQRLAPTSIRICCDLAYASQQIGDTGRALALYEKAADLGDLDGEANFNGALLALEANRPLEEVEAWIERTLAIDPGHVLYVDGDEEFHVLRGRPRYEEAVTRAWKELKLSREDP